VSGEAESAASPDLSPRVLYRGINAELYSQDRQCSRPGETREREYTFSPMERFSETGARPQVLRTPCRAATRAERRRLPDGRDLNDAALERARHYALGGGRHARGYVLAIDSSLLESRGARAYVVAE
jgi:hypothetical protein